MSTDPPLTSPRGLLPQLSIPTVTMIRSLRATLSQSTMKTVEDLGEAERKELLQNNHVLCKYFENIIPSDIGLDQSVCQMIVSLLHHQQLHLLSSSKSLDQVQSKNESFFFRIIYTCYSIEFKFHIV